MRIRESKGDRAFDVFVYVFITFCAMICLYPLYLVLINSISNPEAVATGKVIFLPKGITFDAYKETFSDNSIVTGYINSLFYTVVGTLLNMGLTIPAAYALSKPQLAGKNIFMMMIVFTMYFSGGVVPSYLLNKELGLLNSWWAIPLNGAVSSYNLIIARSFFSSGVPKELEEAAEIDGCSAAGTFFKIVVPLSKAMLGVIMLYYVVDRWNNYTSALYFLPNASEKYPLQMVLRQMLLVMQSSVATATAELADYYARMFNQIKYAVIVVASVPVLVLYPFVQKYFDKGIMLGSVKG